MLGQYNNFLLTFIYSENFLCASKSPNKSEDDFLKTVQDIFKDDQLTIYLADKFNKLWSLSGDKYSQLKIEKPYPIDGEKYISTPTLSLRVESIYREANQWKSYYREWSLNNYITKRQIDEATQFYQSLQPSFDSNLKKVDFLILISYSYRICQYCPNLPQVQIRMLEIWGEQTGEKISRGVNSISKKDQGRLSSCLSNLAKSGKGIEKLTEGKFIKATWRLDREKYLVCHPKEKLLSPSAIKACKERAHEFKRMKLF